VLGDRSDELLSPERLRTLVPDIADRDVYVCGPRAMTEATRVSLRGLGVPSRHIISEAFG
jgi:ferredoxin-NADP reductase